MGFLKIGLFMAKIYRNFRIFVIWPKRSQKIENDEILFLLEIDSNHSRHILLKHLAEIKASNTKN